MKQIFIAAFFLFSSLASAQKVKEGKYLSKSTSVNTSAKETPGNPTLPPTGPYSCQESLSETQLTNDQNMSTLDRNPITTGILYNRVAGLASLETFNQAGTGTLDASSFGHFLQAYYEMHVANYNNPSNEPCRKLLRDNALYHSGRGRVLMGALRYRFNYIDSNAVRNNQLSYPAYRFGPLYDVAGRTGSPYLEREVIVGAALVDTLQTGSASFVLDRGYLFSNTGVALVSVSINFGNGGAAQTFTPGQARTISYPSIGRKLLTFNFLYADGRRQTTRSGLYVRRAACTNCRNITSNIGTPCRTLPMTASRAFQGVAGQADISYYYSTTPSKVCDSVTAINVTKPVIIIDGFDHDDSRTG